MLQLNDSIACYVVTKEEDVGREIYLEVAH